MPFRTASWPLRRTMACHRCFVRRYHREMVRPTSSTLWKFRASVRGNAIDLSRGAPQQHPLLGRLAFCHSVFDAQRRQRLRCQAARWRLRKQFFSLTVFTHAKSSTNSTQSADQPFRYRRHGGFSRRQVSHHAGLDEWPLATDECPSMVVKEERLEARLGVTHFRLPPEHREPGQGIPPRQSVHPIRALPTMALLSASRGFGVPALVWRT